MTIKQLYYFLKIAETGNLTKAAQLLNISQPPLSYQLKLLEEELQVQLFVRDSRHLHITNEGIYLQNKAAQILSLIDKTTNYLKHFSTIVPNTLNIGTVSSINHNILPNIISEYKNSYPNTIFNIYDGSSFRIMELLDNGVIDLGILREPFNHSLYSNKKIKIPGDNNDEGDFFVAAGKEQLFHNDDPKTITLKELAVCPLIIHRRFEEQFLADCQKQQLTPNIISRNDNIITSIEWARNSFGVAVMPYSSSLLISDSEIKVKKIIDPISFSNIYLIWNKGSKLPISVLEFINLF